MYHVALIGIKLKVDVESEDDPRNGQAVDLASSFLLCGNNSVIVIKKPDL